jgi:hypothetical protein
MSQLHSAGLSSAAEGVPSRSAGGLYCAYVHDVCWAPRPAGANFGQYTADARCLQMRLCLFLDARLFLAQRVRREPCSAIRMKATRVLSSVWFHLRSRYYTEQHESLEALGRRSAIMVAVTLTCRRGCSWLGCRGMQHPTTPLAAPQSQPATTS